MGKLSWEFYHGIVIMRKVSWIVIMGKLSWKGIMGYHRIDIMG